MLIPNLKKRVDFLRERTPDPADCTDVGARPKDLVSAIVRLALWHWSSPQVLPARSFGRRQSAFVAASSEKRLPQEINALERFINTLSGHVPRGCRFCRATWKV